MARHAGAGDAFVAARKINEMQTVPRLAIREEDMTHHVKAVPEGYHTVTPGFVVDDGAAAIEFYKRAFGAEELSRSTAPGGKIMHAELQIGNSKLFLSDEIPEMGVRSAKSFGGSPVGLWLYVPDVDRLFARAVAAGARPTNPPVDMFWGDRFGRLTDPFGHTWSIATHTEDVPPGEMAERSRKFYAEMATGGAGEPPT